ncbi:MAG: hypothetical protein IJV26_02590, partial [Lachnospiraceae bacterium]|nr:hypothetical protein [Lachnospiraceae bacterium]
AVAHRAGLAIRAAAGAGCFQNFLIIQISTSFTHEKNRTQSVQNHLKKSGKGMQANSEILMRVHTNVHGPGVK